LTIAQIHTVSFEEIVPGHVGGHDDSARSILQDRHLAHVDSKGER
jgi:hypothetical protein